MERTSAKQSVRAHSGVEKKAGPLAKRAKEIAAATVTSSDRGRRRNEERSDYDSRAVRRRYAGEVKAKTLDHVAYGSRIASRSSTLLRQAIRMHVIDRQDAFTWSAPMRGAGKLTLFDAEGHGREGCLQARALRGSESQCARVEIPIGRLSRALRGRSSALVEAPTDVRVVRPRPVRGANLGRPEADGRTTRDWFPNVPSFPVAGSSARRGSGGADVRFHSGDTGNAGETLRNHVAAGSYDTKVAPVIARGTEEREDIIDLKVGDERTTRARFSAGTGRVGGIGT